jgi:LPS export ABC transporter protein LptC
MPIHLAGFRIPRYAPDGSLAVMVAGASAVLRDEMLFEIVRPRVTWFSGGENSASLMTFDAGNGNYERESGSARLTDGVTVTGSDGAGPNWQMDCDDLTIETRTGSFFVEGAVQMSRDGFKLKGNGMTGRVDPASRSLRIVSLKSGVRAQLDPESVRR